MSIIDTCVHVHTRTCMESLDLCVAFIKIPPCICSGLSSFTKHVHSHTIYVLGWSSGMRSEHRTSHGSSSFHSQDSRATLAQSHKAGLVSGQPFKLAAFSSHWQYGALMVPSHLPCSICTECAWDPQHPSPRPSKTGRTLGIQETKALNIISTKSSEPQKPWNKEQYWVRMYLVGFLVQ